METKKTETVNTEGWTWFLNTPKWHYLRNGQSLCGRWMTFGHPDLEQGNNLSTDNCITCRNKILKELGEPIPAKNKKN